MNKKWIAGVLLLLLLTGCGKQNQKPAAEPKTVTPLPVHLKLDALEDSNFHADFEPSDVYVSNGSLVINLAPCETEKFDREDISKLAVGDTLMVRGNPVKVESLKREKNHVAINGGYEKGGLDLYANEDGAFEETVPDAGPVYIALGNVALPVAQDFVFTDNSDLDNPGWQISAADFLMAMESRADSFSPAATTVRMARGEIVELVKSDMP